MEKDKHIIMSIFLIVISVCFIKIAPNIIQEQMKGILNIYNQESIGGVINEFEKNNKSIEKINKDYFPFKYTFAELNGVISKLIGKKYIKDPEVDIISLDNNMLYYDRNPLSTNSLNSIEKNLEELKVYSELFDKELIYVQTPLKNDKYDSKLPKGFIDHSNNNSDKIMEIVNRIGIANVDFRDIVHEKNMKIEDIFYQTDHHWKNSTALWAAEELVKLLDQEEYLQYQEENYLPENYTYDVKEDYFLGSQGKKVTLGYVEAEDFTTIVPKFDTEYIVKYPSINKKINGSFEEVFIDKDKLPERMTKDSYYTVNQNASYGYGSMPVIDIINNKINNNSRILILRDSFSNNLVPFLSLSVREIKAIDIRYLEKQGFDTSLSKYLKEFNPDVVMIVYSEPGASWFEFELEQPFVEEDIDISVPKVQINSGIEWCAQNGMNLERLDGQKIENRTIVVKQDKEDELTLEGWALDFNAMKPLSNIYIKIGDSYYKGAYGKERKDVAKRFGIESLQKVGFKFKIPKSVLSEGNINSIEFRMEGDEGAYYYESLTYQVEYE